MKKFFGLGGIILLLMGLSAQFALATNGDNLIGIGPISRSMGGVGIAAAQDAISSVFSNPATMAFIPADPNSEFNFSGTLFQPKVNAKVNLGGTTYQADSSGNAYAIPAIGIATPITKDNALWRFGLAAYGSSGMGVDYRNTSLDQLRFANFGGNPLVAGSFTQVQIMKFAPAVSFQPTGNVSFGLAAHIDYATLDLGSGSSTNYALGAQIGAVYKPISRLSLGLTYLSAQKVSHSKVRDFDGDGTADTMELESPQQIGFGIAYDVIPKQFLLELNAKWVNWSNAAGYKDYDWNDQYVFSIGAQYKPTPKLALRLGYNYGNNPLKEHSNFVGTSMTQVQGKTMPTYYYETFRIIGFPAIAQQHLTFGIGYEFSKSFSLNLGYMYAFGETIRESGTAVNGQPVTLESGLSESSIEFGLTWRF